MQKEEFYNALTALGQARRRTPHPLEKGKAFELWLAFRMADYWRQQDCSVHLLDGRGSALGTSDPFIARGSPGQIARRHKDRPGSIHVDFQEVPGPKLARISARPLQETFELHVSLQFMGRSTAVHECDISLVPGDICDGIRKRPAKAAAGMGAPIGIPPAAIECKKHKRDGPVGEAREMVARLFDLTRIPACPPANGFQLFSPIPRSTAAGGRRFTSYRKTFNYGFYAVARSSGFTDGATKLLDHYKVEQIDAVTGLKSDSIAAEIMAHMRKLPWP